MGSMFSNPQKEDKQGLVENMEGGENKAQRSSAKRPRKIGLAKYNPFRFLRRRPLIIENRMGVEHAEDGFSFITDDGDRYLPDEENNMDQFENTDWSNNWFDPKFSSSVSDHKTQEEVEELCKISTIHEPMPTGVEKVAKWREDVWAPKPSTSNYGLVRAVSLTTAELHIFSRVIYEATELRYSREPVNAVWNYRVIPRVFKNKGYIAPLIFLHPTNEREIMTHIGSFRLNPFLDAKRDIEAQDEVFLTKSHLSYIMKELYMRREECEFPNKSLSLKKAYNIGMRRSDRRNPNSCIPILQCRKPIFGIPYNAYFTNVMDVPEPPMEMIQLINEALKKTGVQVIDLRMRVEVVPGSHYERVQRRETAHAAVQAVRRALRSLNEIKNKARYFVIYSFVLEECPFHFLQMIVRFKPGIPLNPVDWVNDGSFRFYEESGYPAKPTLENHLQLRDVVGPKAQKFLSFEEFQDLYNYMNCSEFIF
ncbi:unnamed protein product [Caenorhabditis brenneri]